MISPAGSTLPYLVAQTHLEVTLDLTDAETSFGRHQRYSQIFAPVNLLTSSRCLDACRIKPWLKATYGLTEDEAITELYALHLLPT
jgi:hypothetical protein